MMLTLFGALVSLRFCSTVLLSGGPSTGLRTGRRWSVGQPRRSAKQTEPLPGAEAKARGPGAQPLVATETLFAVC